MSRASYLALLESWAARRRSGGPGFTLRLVKVSESPHPENRESPDTQMRRLRLRRMEQWLRK